MFLKEEDRQIVEEILNRLAPNLDVFVFGSRATGKHLKKFSDLDLAFVSKTGVIDGKIISKLNHEFEESDLPIRVDVIDLSTVSENFSNIVKSHYELVKSSS